MFRYLIIFLLLVSCATATRKSHKLSSFKTDGCTLYPDGVPLIAPNQWLHCCIVHDMYYWAGGEEKEKHDADRELKACVSKNSFRIHGGIVASSAGLGGSANNVLPWAWGYGWKQNFGYHKLSSEQAVRVMNKSTTIIPGIREYESVLSNKQMKYILENYQKFITKHGLP